MIEIYLVGIIPIIAKSHFIPGSKIPFGCAKLIFGLMFDRTGDKLYNGIIHYAASCLYFMKADERSVRVDCATAYGTA